MLPTRYRATRPVMTMSTERRIAKRRRVCPTGDALDWLTFAAPNDAAQRWVLQYWLAMAFGVDGIFGLEYKIPEIPFALSLGFKPFLEIDTDGRFYGAPDPGFGIKFKF